MNLMTESEYQQLNTWFSPLEGRELGRPNEQSIERIEKRLHQQINNQIKTNECGKDTRSPWDSLNKQ